LKIHGPKLHEGVGTVFHIRTQIGCVGRGVALLRREDLCQSQCSSVVLFGSGKIVNNSYFFVGIEVML